MATSGDLMDTENLLASEQTSAESFSAGSSTQADSIRDEIFELPGFRMGGSLEDDLQSPYRLARHASRGR